jgi:hypothetical protein
VGCYRPAVTKLGCLLEHPVYPALLLVSLSVQLRLARLSAQGKGEGDNVSGADDQQETERDPQRLYAERSLTERLMRQSDPRGDMGRVTEMITPPLIFHERR